MAILITTASADESYDLGVGLAPTATLPQLSRRRH
jgi:hypothetical protein